MTIPAAVRLSVVLPVCDNARFVADAVKSILDQTLAPDEIVIGDDGSRDGTSAILIELARQNSVIRLLRREQRSGLANAANWVVGEARGTFVALGHADDLSLPDRLSVQLAALESQANTVLIGAPAIGIDAAGQTIHPPHLWRLVRPSVFAPFTHSSVMFRRDAFATAGGYRAQADYWEDLDLFWRMARVGKVLVLPRPVSAYRYSDDSFRVRDSAAEVEAAIERMYRQADAATAGTVIVADMPVGSSAGRSVRPRVFIARSWSAVWNGQRPRILLRMLTRARLRPDLETLLALGFVGVGSIAPRLLRRILQWAALVRGRMARQRLPQAVPIEWRPFQF